MKFLTLPIKIGLLLIFFLVPVLYWNSTMYPFITLKTAVFQSLIEIMAVFWLTLIIFYKEYRPRFTPLTTALIIYLVVLLVSAFFGVNFWKSFWSTQARLTGIFLIVHLIFLFFISKTVISSELLWKCTFFGGLSASLIGTVSGAMDRFFGRSNSLFGNPTFLAGYLLLNFFAGLMLFSFVRSKWLKGLILVLTLVAGFGMLLTQTIGDMGALVAAVYFLLIYLLFYLKDKVHLHTKDFGVGVHYKKWFYGLGAVLVAGALFSGIFFLTREYRVWQFVPGLARISNLDFKISLQNRFIAWSAGWQSFQERPWLGYGWENFNVAFNKHYNPILLTNSFSETYWDKPHNIILEYLYTTGVIGLLGFIGFIGAAFYECWRLRKKFPQIIFLVAGLGAYLIQNLVAFDTLGVYLMLFLYLAFIDYKFKEQKEKLKITTQN